VTDPRRCIVCHRTPLRDDQPQTCGTCIRSVAADLAAIVRLHGLLDAELAGRAGAAMRSDGRSRAPGVPLPDLLGLLGPGSDAHDPDAQPDDPPPVAWELSRWEDDWRHIRGLDAAPGPASATTASTFLTVHHGWAAQRHPAFGEYAADLRRILGALVRATAVDHAGLELEAPCVYCGGRLTRSYRPPRRCQHTGPHQAGCDQGGLDDDARCTRCHRAYDPAQYAQAQAQALIVARHAGAPNLRTTAM
jgi:hypothetical protein